jgi:cephalosporin-C deacetylase-like acetyl esterase
VKFDGGAGVGLEQLAGFPEPADFDTFWVRQKAKLADVPMKATLTPVPAGKPGFLLFDVNVDCAGGKPVSGYLTMPEGAAPGSLQAKVGFEGYGVRSAAQEYLEGKLVFNTNAHGIANGQDAEYYAKLQTGELAGYALSQNDNPDTCYFNGMMLRVLRALEFVKARPEWDGKNLAVGGGSQGGFQALVAAGLDREVTACFAFKPWCCDLGGINLGRLRGWRPDYTAALAYYDPVNHAKRITCETRIIAGLGDYVCPPSGLTVLYNNIAAPKQIDYIQGSTHGYDPPDPAKFALGTIPR